MDTAADFTVISLRACENLYHDYSLKKLGPVQANLRVYNSTSMTVIWSCVLQHKPKTLTFNITDLECGVLLSCADKLLLGLSQATDNLKKGKVSGAKHKTIPVDRYEVYTINNKSDSILPLDNLSKSNTST